MEWMNSESFVGVTAAIYIQDSIFYIRIEYRNALISGAVFCVRWIYLMGLILSIDFTSDLGIAISPSLSPISGLKIKMPVSAQS